MYIIRPPFPLFFTPLYCIIREKRKYAHTVRYIMARHMRTYYIYKYIHENICICTSLYSIFFNVYGENRFPSHCEVLYQARKPKQYFFSIYSANASRMESFFSTVYILQARKHQ